MRYPIKVMLVCSIISSAHANVFYKTVDAEYSTVITPNTLQFRTNFNDQSETGLVKVRLPNIDFNNNANVDCTKNRSTDCSTLEEILKGSRIQLHLKGAEKGGHVFTGEIYVDGKNLVYKLIEDGFYKFDYKQTRNKYLILLQKQAMCNGKGMWAVKSISMDKHCN